MAAKHEWRQLAFTKLRAAKALLVQREYGPATELCGLAVECLLKARICADRGLSSWPASRSGFKAHGLPDLFQHDLELLLNSTAMAVHIKSTCLREWSMCLQWKPETRYEVTATKPSASALINAASVVMRELVKNPGLEFDGATEDLPAFSRIGLLSEELAEEHGAFDFFAVWHRTGSYAGSADVIACAPWLDPLSGRGMDYIVDGIKKKLTSDELTTVAGVIALKPEHPMLQALSGVLGKVRYLHVRNVNFNGVEIDDALICTFDGENVK